MAAWTQSPFLQALGWATLNSFWQMALLWGLFAAANHVFKLSASRKFQIAVGALLVGAGWAMGTFILYYQNRTSTVAFFENSIVQSSSLLRICLLAASLTYLLLLLFPAARLYRNWQFVQTIKKTALRKAQFEHRLFVQKVSFLLGIKQRVKVAVSSLVQSPVTVGYLKPIILLPVAAMNQLTTAQVEAVLLHELSHIRRHDYILNFAVSVIHTLLYFNPFVRSFVQIIEAEREVSCDEVVLQFGYDKVDYASALLHFQKLSARHHALALAAAGRQNLLTRVEKIVGLEKKKPFRLVQVAPLFLAMFCVLLFNSVLIIRDAKNGEAISYAGNTGITPWQLNNATNKKTEFAGTQARLANKTETASTASGSIKVEVWNINQSTEGVPSVAPASPVVPADFDDVDGRLSKEEIETVKATVEATKKAAGTLQWKEIETGIGDALSTREKALAKAQYLQELKKVQWSNIEQNLKANYEKLNWDEIKMNVDHMMAQVQLDSIQNVYTQALAEIVKTQNTIEAKAKSNLNPLPDASVQELRMAKETLQKNLDSLRIVIKPKKVVRL